MLVHCSRGCTEVLPGMRWKDALTGSTWEVVGATGERYYGSTRLGGTPGFWCRVVEHTAASKRWMEEARPDGCVAFCGDSIAASMMRSAMI